MPTRVAIILHGAAGRMGLAVSRIVAQRDDLEITAALVRRGSPCEGMATAVATSAAPLAFVSMLPAEIRADVLVDFAGANAFDAALRLAVDRRIAFVSGSTGVSASQRDALDDAGRSIPVLWAANFSLGVAVLTHLVAKAAQRLADWDCEILETHHRRKLDAPSGTALLLGRAVDSARGHATTRVATDRAGARENGSTGYAVVRGGDVVGEHSVMFLGDGERLELAHRATDRDIFARGALTAAGWIVTQPPGVHTLDDMLGHEPVR